MVLFHAGLPGSSGGFLGVDVFFVISGFLITSILLREAAEGRFSIVAFYNRRVRRIFPALFVMLAVVTVAALFLLAPRDLVRFGRSLLATTLFASNFAFFRETGGYFTTSSLEKPLLHTWSLAVEEQFYLVWPLVLWGVLRLGGRRVLSPVLLLACGASFLLAIVWSRWNASATFFLPATRAWELGIGAALATLPPVRCRRPVREAGGILGLAAIIAAITLCDGDTLMFVASGVACFGTAVLIAFNREPTLAAKMLSLRPLVGIGLISYSLYLWHWPLLAFAHYYYFEEPPAAVRVLLIVAAIGLAFVSWFVVERPLRRPGNPGRAFVISAAVMLLLGSTGLFLYLTRGLPDRVSPRAALLDRLTIRPELFCAGCSIGSPAGPRMVLWGDSHAGAISPAIEAVAAEREMRAVVFTKAGCPPFDDAVPARLPGCREFQRVTLERIARLRDVQLVVLAARWALFTEPVLFGRNAADEGSRRFLRDAKSTEISLSDSRRALMAAMPRTVARIKRTMPNATIVLVGQVPEPGFDPAQCMIRAAMFHRDSQSCEVASPAARSPVLASNSLIRMISARDPDVEAIYIDRLTCAGGTCRTAVNGLSLYSDIDHLSRPGAILLLKPCINAIAAGSHCEGQGH